MSDVRRAGQPGRYSKEWLMRQLAKADDSRVGAGDGSKPMGLMMPLVQPQDRCDCRCCRRLPVAIRSRKIEPFETWSG